MEAQHVAAAVVDADLPVGRAAAVVGFHPTPGPSVRRVEFRNCRCRSCRSRCRVVAAVRAAHQDVVAGPAIEHVVATKPEDQVVLCRAVERRRCLGADDDVERTAVGELHPLDVAQPVGAVERVLDRVGHDDLPVRGGREGVFRRGCPGTWQCRYRRAVVSVLICGRCRAGRIDLAVEHLAASVVMLLCSASGVAGADRRSLAANTPICTSSHLSPSMMSSPALPCDDVAAVAAEDDVAGVERTGQR